MKLRTRNVWDRDSWDRTVYFRDQNGYQVLSIGAGSSDSVELFRIPGTSLTIVLSVNERIGYCGIEVHDTDPEFKERTGSTLCFDFFAPTPQHDIHPRWDELSRVNLAKLLLQWWP